LNINSNFLIILVGLPASGKSTFAFKLKELLESNFPQKVKIIDPDIIRDRNFPNSFDFRNEPKIREKNIKLVKEYLSQGKIVISDDLNYYSSMRHDLKLIADSLNIKFYILHISTPLKLCLKRNKERGYPIPNKVIENIYSKFDNFNKYKWDKPFETYDITRNPDFIKFVEKLVNRIALNLQEQKRKKEPIEYKPSTSIREAIDLITRKYVGELLKNPKYRSSKRVILEYRKLYMKSRSNKELEDDQILEDFKRFLNKNLNE
jgi:tRNA uridine 5-carbamoylmethylation protein Kti12